MWSRKVSAKNLDIGGQNVRFFLNTFAFQTDIISIEVHRVAACPWPTVCASHAQAQNLSHIHPPCHLWTFILYVWRCSIDRPRFMFVRLQLKKKNNKKNIHPPCQTIFENTWRLGWRLFCVPNIHVVKSKFTLSIRNAGISGKITRIFQNPIGQNYLWQKHLHSMKNIARPSTKRNSSNNASMKDAR